MINISLPFRPRINVCGEYLVTATSLFSATTGRPVLNFTTMNFDTVADANQAQSEYLSVISKLFDFNPDTIFTLTDEQCDFIRYTKELIFNSEIYLSNCECFICSCKKYEELTTVRMFNLRRVENNSCGYCNSELVRKEIKGLFLKIDWGSIDFTSFNFDWVRNDWLSFQKRQSSDPYKLSKDAEPTRIRLHHTEFGIKHQLLWACGLVYAAKQNKDNEITLHFVEKVKDLAFFVASIAKVLDPNLKISLKGCPVVWLKKEIINQEGSEKNRIMVSDVTLVSNVTKKHIKRLLIGIASKRKEVNVL